ncbi:MAG TPA: hypothetical protein VHY22_13665 [Chthoniobacteraceae bacterium]|jgi:hypothetical protein|nr:hypothetical protein [Chthoniobacteraceae bacterium]
MKLKTRFLFVSIIFTAAAAAWAADDGSLFNSGETSFSTFGSSANGNVDSQPQTNEVYTTTTVTTTTTAAAAPTPQGSPTPRPSPPPETLHKGAKLKAVKVAAAQNAGVTSVTRTYVKRHRVTSDRLEHNAGGGGIQGSYFFTKYLGVLLEGDFLGGNPYDTALIGDLVFRYPFEFGAKSVTSGYSKDGKDGKTTVTGPTWGLAPYIMAGGGGQWDGRAEGTGNVGGGVEVRFSRHYGVFVEGRWVIHDARQNYALESAGFTYSF